MNYVNFDSVGLRLSKIAFGCAPVMGRIGRAQALRAMGAAFDAGVTHFDVARSYGYGEAESVLGQFAAGKRDRITIATKFGIAPPRQQRVLRLIKPVVRQLAHHAKGLRSLVRRASSHALTNGNFDLTAARHSFDQSLRALRVDYVDILFLHDCSPADPLNEELLRWLEVVVNAGKLRAWGIATHSEWIDTLYDALQFKPHVVQYNGSVFSQPVLTAARAVPAILHSPFGNARNHGVDADTVRSIHNALLSDAGIATALDTLSLSQLLIESAIYLSGNNVVLCSMFDPKHIQMNVAAAEKPQFSGAQIRAFFTALNPSAACGVNEPPRIEPLTI
jgi:aryl-alcohol dehydrogenase-like predicted oxidoreductase